ncbi:MAG: SusC/RagA family TonB-linked outer membrane protein [Cyclobacteriaceae bacterium]|nr:SusC/RagA family TonB-linked outer membrane protein [Cyclobacteriaceae bacterium]
MAKHYLFFRNLFAVLFVLGSFSVFAQQRVTGKVTASDDGSAIPGVNILEKGTSNGTTSDASGNFSINVGSNAVLVFTFIGYDSQEVPVGTQTTLNVTMQTNVTALSEIVVIGYGSVAIKDATGAVAAVGVKDFNGGLIANPEQLIQGRVAGVQMVSTSGQPGAGVQFRIRGTNSIRSNNNPLFVVDGVPLAGGVQPGAADVGFGTNQDTNPLNFINPSDIESFSILKDASATAIYGSRGANGVVIITTKSGKGAMKGGFDFASSVSIASPRTEYDLLNPTEFLSAVQQFGGDPVAQNFGSQTDWQDYITRTSVSNKQNLSYSKGFNGGYMRASFGYDNQVGVLQNSSMQRVTGRLNGSKTFMDNKLTIDLSSTFSNVNREDPAISGSAGFQGDLLGAAYSANPTWSTDPDFNTGGQRSPANMLAYYQGTGVTNRFLNNISATYKLNDALSVKAIYGLDWSKGEAVTLASGQSINAGNGVQGFGQGQINENRNVNNLVELYLNYNKQIGNVKIEAIGGYSYQDFNNQWQWVTGRGFTDPNSFSRMESELRSNYDIVDARAASIAGTYNNWGVTNDLRNTGTGNPTSGGFVNGINLSERTFQTSFFNRPTGATLDAVAANFYDQTDFLQSYFGRGNFTVSDKYLLTATIRVDGSSKFGDENKYGVFPSAAAAWKLHEEGFMPDAFSDFKLRIGYGIVGNQDGLGYGEFVRRERFSDVGIGEDRQITLPGTSATGNTNDGLKWEQTATLGVGIDFGIFNDKLTGTFDVYSKRTTDLLLRVLPAAPSPVVGLLFTNLQDAVVENNGWELGLNWNAIEKPDASFTVSGNIAYNKNMLKNFAGALDAGTIRGQGLSGAYAQRLAGGHPLFSYHLREFEGFDSNGQPIGDNQDFVGKTALPIWNMGFSLSARYKAFDISMFMTGQFGHYIYNNTQNAFFTAGSINNARNVTRDVLTSGESGAAEAAVSTRFLYSGDFLRMQDLTVGYNAGLGDLKFIKTLRFYVTGQNLFVITKYNGLDPEVSSSPAGFDLLNGLPTAGIDYAAYPRPRIFTIGLIASF